MKTTLTAVLTSVLTTLAVVSFGGWVQREPDSPSDYYLPGSRTSPPCPRCVWECKFTAGAPQELLSAGTGVVHKVLSAGTGPIKSLWDGAPGQPGSRILMSIAGAPGEFELNVRFTNGLWVYGESGEMTVLFAPD